MAPPQRKVFGQTMHRRKGPSRYQRQTGGNNVYRSTDDEQQANLIAERRRAKQAIAEKIDESFGIERFVLSSASSTRDTLTRQRRGWLYNILPTTVTVVNDSTTAGSGSPERAGLELFFCRDSGDCFKSTILYRPYFYVVPDLSVIADSASLDIYLELLLTVVNRLYEGRLYHAEIVDRVDLDQPNHLSPKNRRGRPVLKLIFDNVSQLMDVREQVRELVAMNQKRGVSNTFRSQGIDEEYMKDPLRLLTDMREYDVPYVVRVCTDLEIRVGTWYTVVLEDTTEQLNDDTGGVHLADPDRESKANPTFLAFDIECTKAPLKFPSAEVDEIFMISYMVSTATGSQGYLIVSRSIVSQDVEDFEYTPKPNYPGPFKIFNEPDEKALLQRFFTEYQKHRPQIVVTYNGDFFDWPFVEARAKLHGMDIFQQLGVEKVNEEYKGRCSVHMDAFHWVQRDSYLPQGAQGLKAVTKYKLGYDPVEVDPEDMVNFAQERPVHMATYSVSDAVATYYLYEKYVHLFIFSLCTIIPMGPEDVLRKGSGTLCETLLMVEACRKSIICPNKEVDGLAKFHNGHLLESETYIGGKVECLETGVYRSDLEYEFDLKPAAFQHLIDNIDRDLTFAIEVEGGKDRKDIVNCDEIRTKIIEKLELLRDRPSRFEHPFIYHLDVGAMYPNIILSNRLQPSAIVNDATCAACDFNQSKNGCKRRMKWIWRGDYSPATRNEYDRTKDQLANEQREDGRKFSQLSDREQAGIVATRLKEYSRKAYKKLKVTEEIVREDIVCMRENDFYVDTVRQFRDRRYEYKKLDKAWKKKAASAKDSTTKKMCDDKVLVYDSLQVAHKCILNSFYGYVMRKGARWRSMEMAGIVTKTGADIITQARELVEQIGRPLELDTDGIWCILPCSFPDNYTFIASDGSKLKLEYPCVMLNAACHDKFTNHQYQTLVDAERGSYETRSECSIFFEVDGPYRCMVLPASTEEGKLLKKRYAVFNFDGSLAELKGFELKRRGELELIKTFQSQVFERFLDGCSLEECYSSVADIANHWMDVLDTRGESLDDDELVGLISENRSMSKQLEDYGDQKGTSQTTARRLGEFLGSEFIKDKGLSCKFVIAEQPFGAPITERAIPTAIWKTKPNIMRHYLRKWLKAPGLDGDDLDIRNVLDWEYYRDRLGKTIQKIITIPAALQKVRNPVPRVEHPDWLHSKVRQLNDTFQQQSIRDIFGVRNQNVFSCEDMEDMSRGEKAVKQPLVHKNRTKVRSTPTEIASESSHERRIELSSATFRDWLRQKKSLWQRSRIQYRLRRLDRGDLSTGKKQKVPVSIEAFVKDAAKSRAEREWHVIEVRELTSFDSVLSRDSKSSGEFILWVMIGSNSIQKIHVTVPRTVYISTRFEVHSDSSHFHDFRKVEKHLPHAKRAPFLYEVIMPEHVFQANDWLGEIRPIDTSIKSVDVFEAIYESRTPLMSRILSEVGSVTKLQKYQNAHTPSKSYFISDLTRVEKPADGEYLNRQMSFGRLFLYIRVNSRSKTGIVTLFSLKRRNGDLSSESSSVIVPPDGIDVSRPNKCSAGTFDVGASCRIWIVKPGSNSGQKNVSRKLCEKMFSHLLATMHEAADLDSHYACVAPQSMIAVESLDFVTNDDLALLRANEAIVGLLKAHTGPSLLMMSANKTFSNLRRQMSCFASLPVVSIPFPPGSAHNPDSPELSSLNWEQISVQLCFEAFLYTTVIAFPKRISYARYGHVPVGNLGPDENLSIYEVSLSRVVQKNRTLLWSNTQRGHPDLGVNFMPSPEGGAFPLIDIAAFKPDDEDVWGSDQEIVSPTIKRPGAYRSICVDVDIQDLAVAALSDLSPLAISASSGQEVGTDPSSPNSVGGFDRTFGGSKTAAPLGDEMATSTSLSLVRVLVGGWLRDAFVSNSLVADELLHHIYRFISNPDSTLHDPALHRVVHMLMRSTFFRLLGELQQLGCSVVHASFNRLIVETNKTHLADAEEYIDFILKTSLKSSMQATESSDGITRLSLTPRTFHTHFLFLDEHNFGTIQLDRMKSSEMEVFDVFMQDEVRSDSIIVPSVVSAWSLINFLHSTLAQEYFKSIVGRFSNDVFKKQKELLSDEQSAPIARFHETRDQLLEYSRKLVSQQFASFLTRAISEIATDGVVNDNVPAFAADTAKSHPVLQFAKSVVKVLELDSDLDKEVQALKRSLFAQIGIAEYSNAAVWSDPCPSFMLYDVFCHECQDNKDVDLCYVPQREEGTESLGTWVCEDCSSPYNISEIESRLIRYVKKKVVCYQLQDVNCSSSKRVATRCLAPYSVSSAPLTLGTSEKAARAELELLMRLAEYNDLIALKSLLSGVAANFFSM